MAVRNFCRPCRLRKLASPASPGCQLSSRLIRDRQGSFSSAGRSGLSFTHHFARPPNDYSPFPNDPRRSCACLLEISVDEPRKFVALLYPLVLVEAPLAPSPVITTANRGAETYHDSRGIPIQCNYPEELCDQFNRSITNHRGSLFDLPRLVSQCLRDSSQLCRSIPRVRIDPAEFNLAFLLPGRRHGSSVTVTGSRGASVNWRLREKERGALRGHVRGRLGSLARPRQNSGFELPNCLPTRYTLNSQQTFLIDLQTTAYTYTYSCNPT